MIVYMTENGKYFPPNAEKPRGLYVNLTNRCNNDCPFCLRQKKVMTAENSLWLESEPTVDEVKKELDAAPWQVVKEIVFCGFGEPTIRLAELLEILKYVKKIRPQIPTRLNTNGLGNLEHGRNIEQDFEKILDTASISLNAATAERYLQITRSKFGLQAYGAMLDFAENMKKFVPHVVLTIVDKVTPPAEIEQCKKICEERGLTLRIRPYEDN
ncbi:MAG: radical SAM protein [Selenomonadaceae bacterium]|nr:radical SAM protein [Selenomonadaceae bacterium]